MDAQSDSCEPPPCDLQPPGKIRKALKLFSKRKAGNGVASIFSARVKGEGGLKSPPSRSKTLDGLTDTMAPEAGAESVDLDSHKEDGTLDDSVSMKNNMESISTRQSISSLTSAKSLSFLSMLRRNRKGGGGEREAQTESHRSGQQRKSLKNLFGSVRWHRKDKEEEDEDVPSPPLLASRSNSVEIMKENLTLTPRPARPFADDSEFEHPPSQDVHITPEDTNKVSGAAKPLTNDRLSTLLGDISSILNLDSLAGDSDIVADVEAEWIKVSNRVEVEAGRGEAVNVEKTLLAPKPTISNAPTLSSTSSTINSPKTKLTSSCIPLKPMPSPTTKQTPPSTKPIQSQRLTTEPVTSPVLCPDIFPIPSPNT
ncbi:APC membrane recruitment protein 2-like, partial [Clarias magur]